MIINCEYTDTYAGEANYSWVKRTSILANDNLSDLAIVRRAKMWAGLNGCRARVEKYCDMIVIKPYNMATILFITFE